MQKIIIGRKELVDFPTFGLFGVSAKVDTGAYTSAIHYYHAEEIERNGKKFLSFQLLDPSHPEFSDKSLIIEDFKKKTIKNSFGQGEDRYIIKLPVKIFDQEILTDFSLSNRGNLKHPILLGRKFLNKRFIVDTSQKYLSKKKY